MLWESASREVNWNNERPEPVKSKRQRTTNQKRKHASPKRSGKPWLELDEGLDDYIHPPRATHLGLFGAPASQPQAGFSRFGNSAFVRTQADNSSFGVSQFGSSSQFGGSVGFAKVQADNSPFGVSQFGSSAQFGASTFGHASNSALAPDFDLDLAKKLSLNSLKEDELRRAGGGEGSADQKEDDDSVARSPDEEPYVDLIQHYKDKIEKDPLSSEAHLWKESLAEYKQKLADMRKSTSASATSKDGEDIGQPKRAAKLKLFTLMTVAVLRQMAQKFDTVKRYIHWDKFPSHQLKEVIFYSF